jgi:hypothetical protein
MSRVITGTLGKMPLRDEHVAGALGHRDVLLRGAVARMLGFRGRPDQAAGQEEVDPRLEVREVRHGHEDLAAGPEHAPQLGEGLRLIVVGEVLEDVETERTIEAVRLVGQRRHRAGANVLGGVVGIDTLDGEPACVLGDEDAFAAAGVEHARRRRQLVEPAAHGVELRDVRRIVVPAWIRLAVIVASRGVFAAAHYRRAGAHDGGILTGSMG